MNKQAKYVPEHIKNPPNQKDIVLRPAGSCGERTTRFSYENLDWG